MSVADTSVAVHTCTTLCAAGRPHHLCDERWGANQKPRLEMKSQTQMPCPAKSSFGLRLNSTHEPIPYAVYRVRYTVDMPFATGIKLDY